MKKYVFVLCLLLPWYAAAHQQKDMLYPQDFCSFINQICENVFCQHGYAACDIPEGLLEQFAQKHTLIMQKLQACLAQAGGQAIPCATAQNIIEQTIADWAHMTHFILVGKAAQEYIHTLMQLLQENRSGEASSLLVPAAAKHNPKVIALGNRLERLGNAYNAQQPERAVPYQW